MNIGDVIGASGGGAGYKIARVGLGKPVEWPGAYNGLTAGTILQSLQWPGYQVYVMGPPFDDIWAIDEGSNRTISWFDRTFKQND